ncbi:hypothetical protein MMG00_12070 [Ignatzschineria rhizosphaerae]|uniref:Zinc-finger domain-containing protein n=1 Tax=Ignatzschineria rhizosphaerae TaxID=2923279 RepID=A0ABY3WZ80_9GAMM|nr:hypothetical protein [Ignatzschineria rhizosphaerae]UNM95921.1 hypothetical protein MMG00_12070 [Ignatzschineria rhizosphaerae]
MAKETEQEREERIIRTLDLMFQGADQYPCECGVMHFELPEKGKTRLMACGNCGRHFTVRQDIDA